MLHLLNSLHIIMLFENTSFELWGWGGEGCDLGVVTLPYHKGCNRGRIALGEVIFSVNNKRAWGWKQSWGRRLEVLEYPQAHDLYAYNTEQTFDPPPVVTGRTLLRNDTQSETTPRYTLWQLVYELKKCICINLPSYQWYRSDLLFSDKTINLPSQSCFSFPLFVWCFLTITNT